TRWPRDWSSDVCSSDLDGQRTDLAMTWAHLLFDGAGSELFIRRLDECFHGRRAIADLTADDPAPARPRGTLRERARRAQWWQARSEERRVGEEWGAGSA